MEENADFIYPQLMSGKKEKLEKKRKSIFSLSFFLEGKNLGKADTSLPRKRSFEWPIKHFPNGNRG